MSNKGKDESTIRALVIVSMLNERQPIKAKDIINRLSAHFDITANRKTIYTDMRAIDKIIPIEVIPGRNGGYRKFDFSRCEDGK